MEKLKAKHRKQSGFTLIEMLIVVAIIAILVAVSIPMVNNALERAKIATDAANERAAKAEILIQYLADAGGDIDVTVPYMYDAASGGLAREGSGTAPTAYGKCENHKGSYILVRIKSEDDPVVEIGWSNKGWDTNLCSAKINE